MTALTPGQAAFAAHYGRSAGRPLKMPESWDMQPGAVRADWDAAAQAAIEAGPSAAERLAKGNTKLREERDRLRGKLQAVRQLMADAAANGVIDSRAVLALLDAEP